MNFEPLQIIDTTITKSRQEIMAEKLRRNDLFVSDSNIYLLTSVEKQSMLKIAALIRRIKQEATQIIEFSQMPSLQFVGKKTKNYTPTIDLYIKSKDVALSDKSMKLLSALYTEILSKGIHIKLHSLIGREDKLAVAVNNMINHFQIQQIKQDLLNQKTK